MPIAAQKILIARPVGGLANQMGVYAAARALAHTIGVPLKLDPSWFRPETFIWSSTAPRKYGLGHLNIQATTATSHELLDFDPSKRSRIRRLMAKMRVIPTPPIHYEEHALSFDPAFFSLTAPAYITGNFPSIRYYLPILPLLRAEFQVVSPLGETTRNWQKRMDSTMSVSLHVRRGDYVKDQKIANSFGVLETGYYDRAMEIIRERVSSAEIFVFSDDIAWTRDNIKPRGMPIHFVDANTEDTCHEDFHLMCRCKHHIIANSGFSRWPAILNPNPEKVVVAPRTFLKEKPELDQEFLCKDWTAI